MNTSFVADSKPNAACVAVFSLLFLSMVNSSVQAGDLREAREGMVKYELSNLRIEKSITGDVIVFDYKRLQPGSGIARLAGRSDEGTVDIMGLGLVIRESGTIRLKDQMAGIRSILSRGEGGNGIEFYFVVGDVPFGFSGIQYLVSNPIRHGKMSTKLDARKRTKAEAEMDERRRIARNPPETVPDGYQRATANTQIVVGAPVKFGSLGKWKDAIVASISTTGSVKLVEVGDAKLRTIQLADWVALSEKTIKDIETAPEQFSIDIRLLKDGNLILPEDVVSLDHLKDGTQSLTSFPKGTPMLLERKLKWVNAYFMNVTNDQVRVMVTESKRPRIEFLPLSKLGIRQQTLIDIKDQEIKTAYAENLEAFENRALRLPGESGSMETVGSFQLPGETVNPFDTPVEEPKPDAPMRTWSDSSGEFQVAGSLVSEDKEHVILKRKDGKKIQVPLELLSKTDLTYLAELKKPASKNPFDNVIDAPERAMLRNDRMALAQPVSSANLDFKQPMQLTRTIGDLGWGAASVAISPNNRFLLIGRKASCASLVDLKTGAMIVDSGRMDHLGNVSTCGFTPDGRQAVIGGSKGVIEVYDLSATGQMKLKQQVAAHTKEITSLCFSADGKFALSGSADKEARYWEVETGKQLASLGGFSGKVKATRITPDGKLLLATDGEVLQIYDVAGSKMVRQVKVGSSWAAGQSAAFSPNGLLLAVGDGYDFHLWNLVTFTELPTIEGTAIGWSAVFCPDNRHFLSGSNGVVNVWDAKTQTRVLSNSVGSSFYVQAINTSADGTLIACPSAFKEVKVLKAATLE
ncbi:MAG: SHD1 domain-containing protein [Fuerstiella sp.]